MNQQKFNSAKERFVYFLELQGSNRNKFYQQSGMSQGALDKSGGLSEDSLLKICNVYPEISLDWLLLGKGEVIRHETAQTVSKAAAPQVAASIGDIKIEAPAELLALLTSQQETIKSLTITIDRLTSK